MTNTDRRQFLQLLGMGAVASTLGSNIAKALAIPANNRTGTIKDVEHIVILMQENRPFDHHFGTLRGVRGFSDPRAVKINLPLQSGGTVKASVFLQPAGAANVAAGFGVPPNYGTLGGPANGVPVIPPFRVNPSKIQPGLTSLGLTYFPEPIMAGAALTPPGTRVSTTAGRSRKGPLAMSYITREDIPYHYALADAFTVVDNYYSFDHGPDQPESLLPVDRLRRQRQLSGRGRHGWPRGGPDHRQRPQSAGLLPRLGDASRGAGQGWRDLEDLPGPRRCHFRAGLRGRRPIRQFRRQLHRQFDAVL